MIVIATFACLLALGLVLAGRAKCVAFDDANRQCGGYW